LTTRLSLAADRVHANKYGATMAVAARRGLQVVTKGMRMTTKFLAVAILVICAVPVNAGDLGLSITVGQPGFFGQISLGNIPQPQLIYPQSVVIQQVPEFVSAPPIYLHVPPGYEKHWSKHCAQYNACGRRVYFVRDDWYNREYVPRYQNEHGTHDEGGGHEQHGHGGGHDNDHGHDEGHDH
jgi:hypothetical protein